MASHKGVGRTEVRVMAEDKSEQTGRRRMPWPLLVAIALIIGGVVFVMARQGGDQAEPDLPAGTTQYSQAALVEEVDAKLYNKDYDGAIAIVKGQNQADEPQIKLMLVSIYMRKGDTPAALQVYKELDQQGKLKSENYGSAAELALQNKDYATARDYYSKAIERARSEDIPTAGDDIASYRARLAEIKDK